MKPERRFLIPRSFARLIANEGFECRVVEGYFPAQESRRQLVRIEGERSQLVLVTKIGEDWTYEAVDVPQSHARALIDVAYGHLAYDRAIVYVEQGTTTFLDRIFEPGVFDLLTVEFNTEEAEGGFKAPPWFGSEVTQSAGYTKPEIAAQIPAAEDVLSNVTLESLLDMLENRAQRMAAVPHYKLPGTFRFDSDCSSTV